jgi:hypothetical protein
MKDRNYKFVGSPEEVLETCQALVDHKHDGFDASDIYFDMLLLDLRKAIKAYDKKYDPSEGAGLEKMME